jgi:hypothetical protein
MQWLEFKYLSEFFHFDQLKTIWLILQLSMFNQFSNSSEDVSSSIMYIFRCKFNFNSGLMLKVSLLIRRIFAIFERKKLLVLKLQFFG